MSRVPLLLRELYKQLKIMAGEMMHDTTPHFSIAGLQSAFTGSHFEDDANISFRSISSVSEHCVARDQARSISLHIIAAKQLALKLAGCLKHRLGDLWKPVV